MNDYIITIWRNGARAFTRSYSGYYCDAVAYAKTLIVYSHESFTVEPFTPYVPNV